MNSMNCQRAIFPELSLNSSRLLFFKATTVHQAAKPLHVKFTVGLSFETLNWL